MKRYPQDWERIQRIGLQDDVANLEEYETRVITGLKRAKDYLVAKKALVPTVDQIKVAHAAAFGAVHPWAGSFRQVEVMAGTMICTHPARIEKELKRLHVLSEEAFSHRDARKRLFAIAFYHANLEEIHPFLDGNGRIGRAIIEAQLALSFRKEITLTLDRGTYISALRAACGEFDFHPLAELLSARVRRANEVSKEKELSFKKAMTKEL